MKPEKLSELLRMIRGDNPRASEAEIREICRAKVLADQALIGDLFDYWFGNSFRDFAAIGGVQHSFAVVSAYSKRQPSETRAATLAATRAKINALKGEMMACLMDHALSDGTLLRFATFGQCAREGNWLSNIAKHGKPNEVVGKKLTEADLQNLHQRHQITRKRAAA